jgi:hypothetical protein
MLMLYFMLLTFPANKVTNSILIGYYTVLCTIRKYIVRVCIVLKTRIGRNAA